MSARRTYYKAIRPDGTDFHTGKVQWAPPEGHEGEWIVRHPTAQKVGPKADEYLSVSTVPTDCTGMSWPCRLLEVQAVGHRARTPDRKRLPNKRAGVAFRVVRELPAHEALGPQGEHVAALIERARLLTSDEVQALNAAGDAARYAAGDAAGDAARYAAGDAAWDSAWEAAWDAAWYAARALAARDLIGQHGFTQEHYDALTGPWRRTIGPVHPDDAPMDGAA